jgi:hypothetical protein
MPIDINVANEEGRQRVEAYEHRHGATASLVADVLDSGTQCVTVSAFCRAEFNDAECKYIVTINNFSGENKWSDIDIWDIENQRFVFTGELHTLVEKLRA